MKKRNIILLMSGVLLAGVSFQSMAFRIVNNLDYPLYCRADFYHCRDAVYQVPANGRKDYHHICKTVRIKCGKNKNTCTTKNWAGCDGPQWVFCKKGGQKDMNINAYDDFINKRCGAEEIQLYGG